MNGEKAVYDVRGTAAVPGYAIEKDLKLHGFSAFTGNSNGQRPNARTPVDVKVMVNAGCKRKTFPGNLVKVKKCDRVFIFSTSDKDDE
jgi:hypothetical protein